MTREDIEQAIKSSTAQLLKRDGVVVGCGLVVDERNILTCAHVVADALGIASTQSEKPAETINVFFPFSRSRTAQQATLTLWVPCMENRSDDKPEDMAVLSLTAALPNDILPRRLQPGSTWAGRPYMAVGFPASNPFGAYVDGKFKGEQTRGWVQLLAHDATDLQFEEGFSGGGVWDLASGGVAGILVAGRARGANQKTVAFMLPTEHLARAWPALPTAPQARSAEAKPNGWPRPPAVVHRYKLLDTARGLVGRREALSELQQWTDDPQGATVRIVHAIGGMGKSALAWTWFEDSFARSTSVAGGMWYSFYEPNASFGDFLNRLYSYVQEGDERSQPRQDLGSEQFEPLFQTLRRLKLVIVLDGFERLLRAYGSERLLTGKGATNPELTEKQDRYLCFAPDENVNAFLTALAQPMASRFLITSRLVPAATLNSGGTPRGHVRIQELDALEPDDVVAMMAAYGVSGSPAKIIAFANKFGRHALLVKLIAAMVGSAISYGKNFDLWLTTNPSFDPVGLQITEHKVHVLQCALTQLDGMEQDVLLHIAALRGAISYTDLADLVLVSGRGVTPEALEAALKTLHQLTLIEWDVDGGRNQFDLHPLVRNTVWLRATTSQRTAVDQRLISEFQAFPDLQAARETGQDDKALSIFDAYVRRGSFDDAWELADRRFLRSDRAFEDVTQVLGLTQALLTAEGWPRLSSRSDRSECLIKLAKAYELACDYDQALRFYERHRPLCSSPTCMLHQAAVLEKTGRLTASKTMYEMVLDYVRGEADAEHEIIALEIIGANFSLTGPEMGVWSRRMSNLFKRLTRHERAENRRWLLWARMVIAMHAENSGNIAAGRKLVALHKLEIHMWERNGGILHLPAAIHGLAKAEERAGALEKALATAQKAVDLSRKVGMSGNLASAQITLASIHLKLGNPERAGQLLTMAEETVFRCRWRKQLGRIRELQARLARDAGDLTGSRARALEAFDLACGESPPLSYQPLLKRVTALLAELGVNPPSPISTQAAPSVSRWRHLAQDTQDKMRRAPTQTDDPDWELLSPAEAERLMFVPNERTNRCEVEWALGRARSAIEQRDMAAALYWSSRAMALDPEGDDCWSIRALCCLHGGDLEEAEKQYATAISLSSSSHGYQTSQHRADRFFVLALLGLQWEARSELGRLEVKDIYEKRIVAAEAYVVALTATGSDSVNMYHDKLEYSAPSFWSLYFAGCLLIRAGDADAAAGAFRQADAIGDPEVPEWLTREVRLKSLA